MTIHRRTFLLSAAATLAAPAIVRAQASSYVIGTLFPMSGFNAEYGAMYTNAVQLAVEHVAAEKMLKKPIELKAQDSLGTPQGGAVGMTRLASVDQCPFVLVGFTGVSKAAAPIGDRSKVVMVNGGGVGPDLGTLSPYFWNVIPLADYEIRATLPWMKSKGYRRIGLIYTDDPAGMALHKELASNIASIGAELVGNFSIPVSATQFAAVAAKVRDAQPDAVYFASISGPQIVQIIKQLRDNGVSQQLITYSAGNLPSVLSLPESEGLIFTSQAAEWDSTAPLMKRFVTGWRTSYKTEPTIYGLNYYNAALLYAQLLKRLEDDGKAVTGETLQAERMRVKTFSLAGGQIAFADNGTVDAGIQLNQLKGGRNVKLAT